MSSKDKRKQELKGKAEQVEGKVREEVAKITGNKEEQIKGMVLNIKGKTREKVAKATE